MSQTTYTGAELVAFGNLLLRDRRGEESGSVSHADLMNAVDSGAIKEYDGYSNPEAYEEANKSKIWVSDQDDPEKRPAL